MIDEKKIRELVRKMAIAEASYGCGHYSEDDWTEPYEELLAMFGYDDKWGQSIGERLHSARWARGNGGERLTDDMLRALGVL